MLGVRIRLHSMTGDDLGTATVPSPISPGDLVLTEHGEYRVYDVIIETGRMEPIAALVKVQPAHLHAVAAR